MEVKNKLKVGSDFSGVGAFDQALIRLGIDYETTFACDMDKYARQTYSLNFGEPKYYPTDVYDREIPKESLDIYMSSPPCQSFSLAGKRKGEDDKRGILFYNTHEFIQKNNPKYFIIENVKGLLSDSGGKTFQRWLDFLGGKSINGNPVIFPHEGATPYHVYYQVLNAKHYGIPQNRERVFIIGIRDDSDNNFSFPKPFPLGKRLKDVLESEVDEKYFLSDKMIEYFDNRKGNFNGVNINFKDENSIAFTITKSSSSIDISDNIIRLTNNDFEIVGDLNKGGERGIVFGENSKLMNCLTATDYKQPKQVQVGTWRTHEDGRGFRPTEDNNCPTIPARAREDGSGQPVIKIGAFRGRNPENPKSRVPGIALEQTLEVNEDGISNTLTSVQKDNVVVYTDEIKNPLKGKTEYEWHFEQNVYSDDSDITRSIMAGHGSGSRAKVIIPANNSKGYDIAEEEEEDSINFSNLNSETRRGRVGNKVRQTLDTACNQGIYTRNLFNTDKSINFDGILKSIDNEKRNTAETLLMLQQEIGKTAIETWGLRVLEIIREKDLLRQELYEESVSGKRTKTSKRNKNKDKQKESSIFIAIIIMRSLPKEGWERCTPQRRKSIKQLIRQFNESLPFLSYKNTSSDSNLQGSELQHKDKRSWLLRQTLSEIQEIWKSINSETQSVLPTQRIRRLTPTEAFRLMDFNDNFKWEVSDSQAYKQAGNSICVGVLVEIIKKLNINK